MVCSHPSRYWFRYVDHTWVIQQQCNKQAFLDQINNIVPAIQFTVEGNKDNGAIPFLDTLVTPQAEHSFSITVYHKHTHTDQYLQLDNNHNLAAKYSVIGILTHRANTVCTTAELCNEELEHLRETLVKYKYPRWAINKIQNKYINSNWEENGKNNNNQEEDPTQGPNNPTCTEDRTKKEKPSTGHIVVLYVQGLEGNLKKICSRYWVPTYFKGSATIKQLLVRPKDQDPKDHKNNFIYSYQCGEVDCDEECIEDTPRILGERYKEYLKEPSPIHVHRLKTGTQHQPRQLQHIRQE